MSLSDTHAMKRIRAVVRNAAEVAYRQRVAAAQSRNPVSHQELCRISGISPTRLTELKRSVKNASPKEATALARALQVCPKELYLGAQVTVA